MKAYQSATARLADLPEVFTGRDLTAKFQWPSAIASTYLGNWRKAGLVRSLGGHSDVHMNLLRSPQVSTELALRRAYPEALKIGADVLREAGWTTQIMQQPEVAVMSTSPLFQLDGYTLQRRSLAWFDNVQPGIEKVQGGLDLLRPTWAFADMLARALDRRVRNAWLLAPDDIELEDVAATPGIGPALAAFGLPAAQMLSTTGYGAVYDQLIRRNQGAK
ncbi:MAG: hypothetical protein ABIP34_12100 [Rhodoferax sp.]|uniref:hypothetical protein n=1 Tax=Rhodoferax sp. TaxID=50421 RepID=UPI003265C08E